MRMAVRQNNMDYFAFFAAAAVMAVLRFSFRVSSWRFRLRAISLSLSRMVRILLSYGIIDTVQRGHYNEDGAVCQYVRLNSG